MSKSMFIVAALTAALAMPATATAAPRDGSSCSYTGDGSETRVGNDTVAVYTGDGVTDQATVAAGACVNLDGAFAPGGNRFDGGTAEAGAGTPAGGPGGYAVVDGDNDNLDQSGQNGSQGYVGLSNFETGAARETCEPGTAGESGSGTNSGGCLIVRDPTSSDPSSPGDDIVGAPVPLLACGNDSGKQFEETTRDGCSIP